MSHESAPAPETAKPVQPKTGVARILGRLLAILGVTFLAILTVRTVAFALSEKRYKSTAQIGIRLAERDDIRSMTTGWNNTSLITDALLDSKLAERAISRLQVRNIKVVTAGDPAHAQLYLDALCDLFFAHRREESEEILRYHTLEAQAGLAKLEKAMLLAQQEIAMAKNDSASPETLKDKESALEKLRGEIKELTHWLKRRGEAAQDKLTILKPPSPAVRIIPRFTFLRLF